MSKKCSICGYKVGFFSGKFIKEKYVCKSCFEAYEKERLANPSEEKNDHTLLLLSEAYAKPGRYHPWPWSSKKKEK